MSWGNNYGFRPYVSVAERRRKAQREVSKLAKKGKTIQPILIEGRAIASTFWGKSWCDTLEAYSDYANRLPRGRTYVRNGSVVHLEIRAGEIEAIVSGSELYRIKVKITPAAKTKWQALCKQCAGGIGSLVELLQARLSDRVMGILMQPDLGLFPSPKEIQMTCSCPDSAGMCKHLAAVLYGVGSRLDHSPELLFVLRSVDYEQLISQAITAKDLTAKPGVGPELSESEIGDIFGIELEKPNAAPKPAPRAPGRSKAKAKTKTKPAPPLKARLKSSKPVKITKREKARTSAK